MSKPTSKQPFISSKPLLTPPPSVREAGIIPPQPWPEKSTRVPCCDNCDALRRDARGQLRCHAGLPQVISPSDGTSAWPKVPASGWCRQHNFTLNS